MKSQYKFTVIIPHKNRQQLLRRCLNSLPRRDDIQIIVVDDNSDPEEVDFSNFPGLQEKNVEVYFTKEGKGAGYARNVGLDYAKGEWVLFADSDDQYLDNLEEEMDKNVNSNMDMIIYRQKRKDVNGNAICCYYDNMFDEAAKGNIESLKLGYVCPIAKFIKKQLIEKYHIRFQEVMYSNDVLFALKVYHFSNNIQFVNKQIYCVYESTKSLMRNTNWENPYTRTKVGLKAFAFLRSTGKISRKSDPQSYWFYWMPWWKKTKQAKPIAALLLIPRIYFIVGNAFLKYLVKACYYRIKTFLTTN